MTPAQGRAVLIDAAAMQGELRRMLIAAVIVFAIALALVAAERLGWRGLFMTLLIAAPMLMCLAIATLSTVGLL